MSDTFEQLRESRESELAILKTERELNDAETSVIAYQWMFAVSFSAFVVFPLAVAFRLAGHSGNAPILMPALGSAALAFSTALLGVDFVRKISYSNYLRRKLDRQRGD